MTMLAVAAVTGWPGFLCAQLADSRLTSKENPEHRPASFTLSQFISAVAASNLDLAAQRYNVSIARAQLIAARVSPNPTLNLGGNRDLSHKDQPANENLGLSQLIELGGKRRFRVSAATRSLFATAATVEDFFRTLRGTAANAFIDAVAGDMIVVQKRKAFDSLNKLSDLNRIRLHEGDIADVDYNQALVDSLRAQGDLTAAEATAQTSRLALLQLLGRPAAARPRPVSDLQISGRNFQLPSLLDSALRNRPDIVAARNAYAAALASARLARANRISDPTLSVSLQQNESGRNPINPSPNFNFLSFGVSFPLPLFNTLRGESLAAAQTALQSETTVKSLELKAEIDVRQAFERFEFAKRRAAQYQGKILELADQVLDARLAAYKTGGATLLDVLNAQKAETDVRLSAIDALTERAKALVALEQAAGFWDVNF